MNELVALELNLVNNDIKNEGLIRIIENWNKLDKLTWIIFDLIGNKITSVDLIDIWFETIELEC